MRLQAAGLLVLVLGVLAFVAYNPTEGFQSALQATVKGRFFNRNQELLEVDLEVARTPTQIQQGLMHRSYLAPRTGMLFWFKEAAPRSFWMRNTLVPLDMVFVTSTGRISNILPSVPPRTEEARRSIEPVQYVVELPGGTAAAYGLRAGDHFQFGE